MPQYQKIKEDILHLFLSSILHACFFNGSGIHGEGKRAGGETPVRMKGDEAGWTPVDTSWFDCQWNKTKQKERDREEEEIRRVVINVLHKRRDACVFFQVMAQIQGKLTLNFSDMYLSTASHSHPICQNMLSPIGAPSKEVNDFNWTWTAATSVANYSLE